MSRSRPGTVKVKCPGVRVLIWTRTWTRGQDPDPDTRRVALRPRSPSGCARPPPGLPRRVRKAAYARRAGADTAFKREVEPDVPRRRPGRWHIRGASARSPNRSRAGAGAGRSRPRRRRRRWRASRPRPRRGARRARRALTGRGDTPFRFRDVGGDLRAYAIGPAGLKSV